MTDPDPLPPPDVVDSAGRLRRLVLAFVVGVVGAAIAYFVADALAKPDEMPGGWDGGSQRRAYGFVLYSAGFAFAGCFAVTLAIQNYFARRAWKRDRIPRAKLRD